MKNIVIIDDEDMLCELMKEILESTGLYQVSVAYDGKAGQELCTQLKPDLIFLDFVMPKVKGDAVLKFLKENKATRGIPVVIMSGLGEAVYFDKEDHRKWRPGNADEDKRGEVSKVFLTDNIPDDVASELGVKAFLPKPFSRKSLLDITQKLLG